jgi:hypothetical protein
VLVLKLNTGKAFIFMHGALAAQVGKVWFKAK